MNRPRSVGVKRAISDFQFASKRRRQNQQRRLAAVLLLQDQQQRQHLDRLAQAHVVGQAGAQPQIRQEPQPIDARLLVGPQGRPQLGARLGPFQVLGTSQARQHFAQPVARVDERPLAGGFALVAAVGQVARSAGQQAHPLDEGKPVLGLRLEFLPVAQGLGQLVPVHFDPLAAQQHQPLFGGEQLAPFGLGKLLVPQGQLHLEVEHRRGRRTSSAA